MLTNDKEKIIDTLKKALEVSENNESTYRKWAHSNKKDWNLPELRQEHRKELDKFISITACIGNALDAVLPMAHGEFRELIKNMEKNNSIFTNERPLTNIERLGQYGKKVLISADFMQGQMDCHNGIEQRACNSESYDRGYSAQYELNERNTAMTEIMESRKWK